MLQKFFSLFNKKIKLRPAIQEKSDIQRVEDIFQELQDIKRKNDHIEWLNIKETYKISKTYPKATTGFEKIQIIDQRRL